MTPKFILQGITDRSHVDAVQHVLALPSLDEATLSVAFATASGLGAIAEKLVPIAERTTMIAGIRNGITSAQALQKCLDLGLATYIVDTGARSILFHPKLYLSKSAAKARLLVGSANLTGGGLASNVEASIAIDLDLRVPSDRQFLDEVSDAILGILDHQQSGNVIEISSPEEIQQLLDSGRVVDEDRVPSAIAVGSASDSSDDAVPRISLNTPKIANYRAQRLSQFRRQIRQNDGPQQPRSPGTRAPTAVRPDLVWSSGPLSRRDLNIPTASNTNPTGNMLFTKGASRDIDQRHYFRENVFNQLDWEFDERPGHEHLERATASFHIVVSGVDRGLHRLEVSHNTRTDTPTYRQGNSMTALHWGAARPIVAQESLLERTIQLYRDADDPEGKSFILEID